MRQLFIVVALFWASTLETFGKTKYYPVQQDLSGKVIDQQTKEPIAYATVILLGEDKSSIIKGVISDEEGMFLFEEIDIGTYYLKVQFMGYKTYETEIILRADNVPLYLGAIAITENTYDLEGVDVFAERTTIELHADKKVINVGKDLTTMGASASEVMNNLPSVNVNNQTGEVSLRGNANVLVMVDGKLSNVPVAQLLKQIPSTSIKSIELITNPSAKYNPEGMSGLINIILKKNSNEGFNGNISLGLTDGIEAKFTNSMDLNYNTGKINVFGSAGVLIGKYDNGGRIERLDGDVQKQTFDFFNNNKSYLFKLGFDYELNDHQRISLFTNQNIFNGKLDGSAIAQFPGTHASISQGFLIGYENQNSQYNLDFKQGLGSDGHTLEFEVDYSAFQNSEEVNFDFSGDTPLTDYADFVGKDRKQLLVNLDYSLPMKNQSKLEAGMELRQLGTDVNYNSTGLTTLDNGDLVPTADTYFSYEMDIHSLYVTFNNTRKQWSYQAGLRWEDVKVAALTNSMESFADKYNQFYPSLSISYELDEKGQLQFNYNRRIDRPGLEQVNPIRAWSTPTWTAFGNERLQPQFTNSFELNFIRRFEKGSYSASLFYRSIRSEINRVILIDRINTSRLIQSYQNFGNTSSKGLELSITYRPFKWWSINPSLDLYGQGMRGIVESLEESVSPGKAPIVLTEEVSVDNSRYKVRLTNGIDITKDLTLQVFAYYRSHMKGIQFNNKPAYFMNAGLRCNFARGAGTINLTVNDIFNTWREKLYSSRPYERTEQWTWETNTIYLGLSYRFGGKVSSANRKQREDYLKSGDSKIY